MKVYDPEGLDSARKRLGQLASRPSVDSSEYDEDEERRQLSYYNEPVSNNGDKYRQPEEDESKAISQKSDQQDTSSNTPGYYNSSAKQKPLQKLSSGVRNFASKNKKKSIAITITAVLLSALGFGGNTIVNQFLPIHFKETLSRRSATTETLQSRRSRLITKAVFKQNASSTGRSQTGLSKYMGTNLKGKSTISRLEQRGFKFDWNESGLQKITYSAGEINIDYTDEQSMLRSMREVDSILTKELESAYPNKSSFWLSGRAKLLRKRFDLPTNPIYEDPETKQLVADGKHRLARIKGFRERLMGNSKVTVDTTKKPTEGENPDPNATENNYTVDASGEIGDEAEKLAESLVEDPTKVIDDALNDLTDESLDELLQEGGEEIFENLAKESPQVAASAAKYAGIGAVGQVLGVVDGFCTARTFLNTVSYGIVGARAYQLMRSAHTDMNTMDEMKAGLATAATVSIVGYMMAKKDSKGESATSSAAYRRIVGNKKARISESDKRRFSIVGGDSFIQRLSSKFNEISGSGGLCKLNNNIVFKAGLGVAGVALLVTTGGASAGINAAIGASIGVALAVGEAIAKPMLIRAGAGAVMDGSEVGGLWATGIIAGAGVLLSSQGANHGMRPLKWSQKSAYDKQIAEIEAREFASRSFVDKYLNPYAYNSITNNLAVASAPWLLKENASQNAVAFIKSPIALFKNALGIFVPKAYAENVDLETQCADTKLASLDIAVDDFCNPIMGIDQSYVENIDPLENEQWLASNGYLDPTTLEPTASFKKLIEDDKEGCFNKGIDLLNKTDSGGGYGFNNTCIDQSEASLRQSIYWMDRGQLEALADVNVGSGGGSKNNTIVTNSNIDVSADTTHIQCAPGTTLVGPNIGYRDGQPVRINVCDVYGIRVNSQVSNNLKLMLDDATSKGITLSAVGSRSGFRSPEDQSSLRSENGCPDDTSSSSNCSVPTAPVGFSNHQMGLAIDFADTGGQCPTRVNGSCASPGNPNWEYLNNNASRFGFMQLASETWHWSVDGG